MSHRYLAVETASALAASLLLSMGCAHSSALPLHQAEPPGAAAGGAEPVPLGPWDCAYPSAVRENRWTSWIQVTVAPSGVAEDAVILNVDPQPAALDFGGVAMECALEHRYLPARRQAGEPVRATYVQRIDFARSPSLMEFVRAIRDAKRSRPPPMVLRNVVD
jgi:hypothetical protein